MISDRTEKKQWESLKILGTTVGLFCVIVVAGLLAGW